MKLATHVNKIKKQVIVSNIVYGSWYHLGSIHHWLFGFRNEDYVSLVTISKTKAILYK